MSTNTEQLNAQSGAYQYILGTSKTRKHWWGSHLMTQVELAMLQEDSATLDRIRAHFQHGADEEAWPPGTPLDVAVGRSVKLARERLDMLPKEHHASVASAEPWTGK